ncbi:MAG: hypothetical protein K0R88_2685 [Solirubrobacterales bacterium]|nr:hypothetical protein [Solirubrobacterales bacterium]
MALESIRCERVPWRSTKNEVRAASIRTRQKIADRFDAMLSTKEMVEDGLGRFNVAPTQSVPAVVTNDDGERELRLLRWGLVPKWAKDLKVGYKMINAKAETITEKKTYAPLKLFSFAALWTRSRVGDELVESATMLITKANAVAARVLNRMPVILPGPEEEEV